MKHHSCLTRKNGFPVFPIGKVNLRNGKNARHGDIWSCWAEDTNRWNLVIQDENNFRAIHGASESEFSICDTLEICHDQTGSRIGSTWRIVAVFPHTKNGLLNMRLAVHKNSISFSTFK